MAGSKKETNENVKNEFKNGPSALDIVKAAEKELDRNTSPCKHMQLIMIHLLILLSVTSAKDALTDNYPNIRLNWT